jgi:hypothetical protein
LRLAKKYGLNEAIRSAGRMKLSVFGEVIQVSLSNCP